jgi:hypothetical protein
MTYTLVGETNRPFGGIRRVGSCGSTGWRFAVTPQLRRALEMVTDAMCDGIGGGAHARQEGPPIRA